MKTRSLFTGFCQGLVLSLVSLPALWSPFATAANLSGATMATFAAAPIEIVQNVPPLVMLTMSMDHQYWLKAYNDYTDLTGDGDIERTYDDSFPYYGYFHAERCYTYDDASQVFSATGVAGGTNRHYCDGALDDAWSGNFLNWATMTRMDIVRKILYGGYRVPVSVAASGDSATSTILERAHLPGDAHSFAKYYNGADIDSLVPSSFGSLKVDKANGGNSNDIDDGDEGISICNISHKSSGSSQGTTGASPTEVPDPAPMLRVAKENFQLWNSNERYQCTWADEKGSNDNSNNPGESGIFAGSKDPGASNELTTPGGSRDHIVRVKTCEATFFDASRNLENCKAYGANLKPEGLLQRYGLDGQVKFGLMTGSYAKNISGGVLRKNVGAMSDEVDVSDGTFIVKNSTETGIIRTLNAVRIYGYGYNNGTYLPGGEGGENCTFQLTDINEGNCRSWGNPMSEIYLESLRYFALSSGRAQTGTFDADDSSSILGLVQDSWTTDPLTTDNFCASLNSIVFNASVSSYDNDPATYGSTFGDPAATTKAVGDGEGITGKDFFIGRTAANANEFCTSKTVASLGEASGLCPEAPTVGGSFFMAGLAHYAHTTDLRTSTTFKGEQTVNTFAVSLATSTPIIEAPIGVDSTGKKIVVKLLPAYRLRKGGNSTIEASNNPLLDGGGALVDFRIVVPHTEVASAASTTAAAGTGHFYAKFYINWEDSEQGGDYDQDMWGTLEYRVNTNVVPATIQVITKTVAQSTFLGQLFGFVINGSTQDGFHAYSGIQGGNYFASAGTDPTGVPGCNNCRAISEGGGQSGAQSHTFTVNPSTSANTLESPLYYAAKWGGFDDSDANKKPNLKSEWDVKNASGGFVTGGDGIPDNFFFVTNPGALEQALSAILNNILEKVSSGTSAAVVANDRIGNGALFQAVYDPFRKEVELGGNEAKWIGTLHALWVDDSGLIREDTGVKGKLEGYNTDKVVELFYDSANRVTKLLRFNSLQDDKFVSSGPGIPDDLINLKTIWNARDRLADLPEGTITTQRSFNSKADTGRHILTWIDTDTDGAVDSGETIALTSANIKASNFMWLDTDTVANGQRLVDWTRGLHTGLTEFRSRVLDYANDGASTAGVPEIMRLGDIVHSTPISVSAPREAIDIVFGDDSYRIFRNKYLNRRQVVYVGANDGMIHAFNAGFYNVVSKTFALKSGGGSETAHPLGTELWAYVPKNLLPHLQWAARQDYSHVYYMDNAPRVFDVKIFADDGATGLHPGGWGTILVATMGYGGGSDETGITVDTASDGVGVADLTPADNVKTKSAVVILDITDPENPPVVLAELTPENLQFTTSVPQAVVVNDTVDGGNTNKWFLVMGTGPSSLSSGAYLSGTSNAELFVYDLSKLGEGLGVAGTLDCGHLVPDVKIAGLVECKTLPGNRSASDKNANVYIGDVTGVDYDFNFRSDAIYFGTVGPASDVTTVNQGSLFRVSMNENRDPNVWTDPFSLITGLNQPFANAPTLQLDDRLRHWVMAASGRYEVTNDRATISKQTLYGVVDPNENVSGTTRSLAANALVDVSKARVFISADPTRNGISIDGDLDIEHTFKSLRAEILEYPAHGGWKRDFTSGTMPSERGVSGITPLGGVILVPAFTPDTALCTAEGTSVLLGLSFETGTATRDGVFGSVDCDCSDKYSEAPPSPWKKAGAGAYQIIKYDGKLEKPSVTRNADSLSDRGQTGEQRLTGGRACGTTSNAAIVCEPVDFEDQIFNGEISWREYRDEE